MTRPSGFGSCGPVSEDLMGRRPWRLAATAGLLAFARFSLPNTPPVYAAGLMPGAGPGF